MTKEHLMAIADEVLTQYRERGHKASYAPVLPGLLLAALERVQRETAECAIAILEGRRTALLGDISKGKKRPSQVNEHVAYCYGTVQRNIRHAFGLPDSRAITPQPRPGSATMPEGAATQGRPLSASERANPDARLPLVWRSPGTDDGSW